MLDLMTAKGRIVATAMHLAAERPWAEVTLHEIADGAGATLADVRREVGSKAGILAAFTEAVDAEVLTKAPRPVPDQAARDRLFEVVMARFDAMMPYRAAIRSITGAGLPDPGLVRAVMASQAWMLEAAGLGTDGPLGKVRVAGLLSVYARVFRAWLDDDDVGLARTMAALDRSLRSGERTMQTVTDACDAMGRLAGIARSAVQGARRRTTPSSDTPPPPPAPEAPSTGATGNPF